MRLLALPVPMVLLASALASTSALGAAPPAPIDDLKTLVETNSGTAHRDGVNWIQEWAEKRLKALGFETRFEENPRGAAESGRLLVAELRPKGAAPRFVTLVMHADTVFEPSSPFQKLELSADGKRATGPGVIDDKGSLLVALGGLERYLKDAAIPKIPLRVVVSPSEEVGSRGFEARFAALSQDSWLALGFEPALEGGAIVHSRRGNRWYLIEVTGKEAHAGRAHAEGINACVELAAKLAEISRLTDYKRDVTVSVGHIEGGQDKFNIVCGSARAKVDARFATIRDRDALHRRIEAILRKPGVRSARTGERAQVRYEIADDATPFQVTPKAKPFIERYLDAVARAEGGKRPEARMSGGGADTNGMAREGLLVLDGLGAVGGKMHTPEEYLDVSSLETRARALADFLATLGLKP